MLVVSLSALVVPSYAASVDQFIDVKPGAWYYNAVDYVTRNGLFSGTTSTKFSPNTGMERGMFVTVLGRLADADTSKCTNTRFTDVGAGMKSGREAGLPRTP